MNESVFYVVSLIFAVAFINFFAFHRSIDDKKLQGVLRRLVIVVSVTVLSSMLALIVPNRALAIFMQSLHFASTEWMLIFLIRFMEFYVGNIEIGMTTRMVVFSYSGLCSISLFLDNLFHHVTSCSRVRISNGELLNKFEEKSPWYELHLYFSYFMVAIAFILLFFRLFRTVKLYRKKYFFSLLMLIVTVALDATCTAVGFDHDFSLYGYTTLITVFIYFTLYYKPDDIINKMLSYMSSISKMGIICFDPEDKCIYINKQASLLFPKLPILADYEKSFKELIHTDDFRAMEEKVWSQDIVVSGVTYNCDMKFAKLYDEKENYIGCYSIITDRTKEIDRYRQERYKATHDSLTGLHNREYFYEKVNSLVHENSDTSYYIICTDIRDFKLINEMFGYEKGNEVLKNFGANIKAKLPDGCVCARLVSDCFGICIPKALFDENGLYESISKAQGHMDIGEFKFHIHVGIYETSSEDTDVSIMCDRARLAIRSIKNNYEVVCAYYDEKLMNSVLDKKHMITEFDSALENNQFNMYLQPQVSTEGKVLGAEALVRWLHPERGMVSPGEFIPAFEESGLIHRLDMCIWEQAAKKLCEWKKQGREDLHISVNISTKDFYYLDLYKTFTNLVEKYDIKPESLKLEITESTLMTDMQKQLELIGKLQKFGFHVEIDDFGSGYSSLNMLKNLKADVLKLDMGFLREINDEERTKVVLSMIVKLAKRLKMTVISEGVEKKEQVDYLTEMGCDMFQGFYFARPIPVVDFENKYMADKV